MSPAEQAFTVRMARGLMRAWAMRWRVVQADRVEQLTSRRCLESAIRLREIARRYAL